MPVIERAKSAYRAWLPVHSNLPRTQRFGIGAKIDALWLELLEDMRRAAYAKPAEKIPLLERAIGHADALRFFLQLAWESALIPHTQFISLGKDVEEVGRMLGAWKKGVVAKTTPRA